MAQGMSAQAATVDDLDARLDNWSAWCRMCLGLDLDQAASLEGNFRSRQPWEAPPAWIRPPVNTVDAIEVESAVCFIPMLHHAFIKGHYVRRWPPLKVLRIAYRAVGERSPRLAAYDSLLAAGRYLVRDALGRPAVLRKERARAFVDSLLAKEDLTVESECLQ